DALHVECGFHILRIGHAMGDDGGLQRYHGISGLQRFAHLRRDIKILVHLRPSKIRFCSAPSSSAGLTVSSASAAMAAAALPARQLSSSPMPRAQAQTMAAVKASPAPVAFLRRGASEGMKYSRPSPAANTPSGPSVMNTRESPVSSNRRAAR